MRSPVPGSRSRDYCNRSISRCQHANARDSRSWNTSPDLRGLPAITAHVLPLLIDTWIDTRRSAERLNIVSLAYQRTTKSRHQVRSCGQPPRGVDESPPIHTRCLSATNAQKRAMANCTHSGTNSELHCNSPLYCVKSPMHPFVCQRAALSPRNLASARLLPLARNAMLASMHNDDLVRFEFVV